MLARFVSLAALAVVAAESGPTGKSLINEQSNIDSLNAENGTTWKAGNNARFEGKRKIVVHDGANPSAARPLPTHYRRDRPAPPIYAHTLCPAPSDVPPLPPPATRAPFPARQA